MPLYDYKNPKNNKIFTELRKVKDWNKPYILKDGTKCERVFSYGNIGIVNKNAEVFEKDSEYVKKIKPKNIKFNDGHIEKYDPRKHR